MGRLAAKQSPKKNQLPTCSAGNAITSQLHQEEAAVTKIDLPYLQGTLSLVPSWTENEAMLRPYVPLSTETSWSN